MNQPGRRAPIVVGVDGSRAALDALDWAAAEAAIRRRPLRVVHAFAWPGALDRFGVFTGTADYGCRAGAEQVLEEAVTRARSVTPDGDVTPWLAIGAAAPAMLEQALDADLIVLGNRGFGRLRGLISPSVGVQVVACATCPVAIVHPFHRVPPGPSVARVVVGVGDSTQSIDAIGYAFQAAAQRGVGLTAVHAWAPRGPADLEGDVDDAAAAEYRERRLLQGALAGWIGQFPDVTVEPKLVRARPAHALITESAGAALTVVGSRGRGVVRGALLGSVSQMLLRHAHSPVAVLRADLASTGSRMSAGT